MQFGPQWFRAQHTILFFRPWIDRPSVMASGDMSVLGLGRLVDFAVGCRLRALVGIVNWGIRDMGQWRVSRDC